MMRVCFSVYLKRCRAELQAFLHVLLQLVLDADLLLFGQCGHWEGSDHCLLPHWTHIETTISITLLREIVQRFTGHTGPPANKFFLLFVDILCLS